MDKQTFDKQSHKKQDFYGDLFLEDSTYQVYGCNMGEFGGSLFFYNKINHKLFFYPSGCVDQVILYHGSYYIFENLYFANYKRITNPEKLIQLNYNNRLFACNWWQGIDSLKKYYSEDLDTTFAGLTQYKVDFHEHSLISFVLNDTLFTIVSADSSTYLAIHQGDSLKQVQKLLDKKLWFNRKQFDKEADEISVSFSAISTRWNINTRAAVESSNAGFVTIRGREIEIAEHPTTRNYIMK